MMAAESNSDDVAIQQLESQPVLSIRAIIPIAQLGETMGERIPLLLSYLQQSGAHPAGPFFVRYHTFGDNETDMETGIPVTVPAPGAGQIAGGTLPGGPVVTTWHTGPHHTLGDAYGRLTAWLQAHDREPDGPAWEVYYWIDPRQEQDPATGQDPANWRTQLIQPFK